MKQIVSSQQLMALNRMLHATYRMIIIIIIRDAGTRRWLQLNPKETHLDYARVDIRQTRLTVEHYSDNNRRCDAIMSLPTPSPSPPLLQVNSISVCVCTKIELNFRFRLTSIFSLGAMECIYMLCLSVKCCSTCKAFNTTTVISVRPGVSLSFSFSSPPAFFHLIFSFRFEAGK